MRAGAATGGRNRTKNPDRGSLNDHTKNRQNTEKHFHYLFDESLYIM